MAIQKQVRELVATFGAHRSKVAVVAGEKRQYQAACRSCDYKGSVTSGGKAEAEALDHAKTTAQPERAEA